MTDKAIIEYLIENKDRWYLGGTTALFGHGRDRDYFLSTVDLPANALDWEPIEGRRFRVFKSGDDDFIVLATPEEVAAVKEATELMTDAMDFARPYKKKIECEVNGKGYRAGWTDAIRFLRLRDQQRH